MGAGISSRDSKIIATVEKSSDEVIDYVCDSCISDGERREAIGFCRDCKDYLCSECYKSHSRNKLSKHHTLLSGDVMPGRASLACDPCKIADEKVKAYGYCDDCKEHLCESCFRSHSRNRLSRHHILYIRENMPGKFSTSNKKSESNTQVGGSPYNETFIFAGSLNMKSKEDKRDCLISGIALVSDTEIVVTDKSNKSVKLYDIKNGILKWLILKSVPIRITAIARDQVAVLLQNESKIQIVSISDGLKSTRTLKTDGYSVDVEYINTKLYVSYQLPFKFQILKLTGVIQKTIVPDSKQLQEHTCPRYFAVSPDEQLIFVSDYKTNTFISLDLNGNILSSFPSQLNEHHDVIISPFGQVYLCSTGNHVIYKMTKEFKDITVILSTGDKLVRPKAMCLNAVKKTLYVSTRESAHELSNILKVFTWK